MLDSVDATRSSDARTEERAPAGTAGAAHPEVALDRPAARLRNRAPHPADESGRAADRGGLALPGAAPPRAPRAHRRRVGPVGGEPPREVLSPHEGRQGRAARAGRRVGARLDGSRPRAQGPREGSVTMSILRALGLPFRAPAP